MECIPKIPHNIVVIIVQVQTLFCAIIQQGKYKKYTLVRVHTISHHAQIASLGVLLNSTWIGANIKNILKAYKLDHSSIAVVCDDDIIPQGYSSTIEASSHHYLSKNLALTHHILNTLYLCPHEDRFLSWWSRIPYAIIMQLQLIAYTHRLNIISVNARVPALLTTYKLMYGDNFRPLQLAADLQRTSYDIAAIIQSSIIHQFFELSSDMHSIPQHIYATILGVITYEIGDQWQK